MAGTDRLYGGSGPDILVADVDSRYYYDNETGEGDGSDGGATIEPIKQKTEFTDGHYGNITQGDSLDDSVDILLIQGDATFSNRRHSNNHEHDRIVVSDFEKNKLQIEYVSFSESESKRLEQINCEPEIPVAGAKASPKQTVADLEPSELIKRKRRTIDIIWRPEEDSEPAYIEQIHVAGLMGDDRIFVDVSAETTDKATDLFQEDPTGPRPLRIWFSILSGGPGNDMVIGTEARDQIFGGPGSDMLYGLGGEDRIWGDFLDGELEDVDYLFAGNGNDDLIGGVGSNQLYAWTFHPWSDLPYPKNKRDSVATSPEQDSVRENWRKQVIKFLDNQYELMFREQRGFDIKNDSNGQSKTFGVFWDESTKEFQVSGVPAEKCQDQLLPKLESNAEKTGLNRMLGSDSEVTLDLLFAGTELDFLYGRAGENDSIITQCGDPFKDSIGSEHEDLWKKYAKSTDGALFITTSDSDDDVEIGYVTNPNSANFGQHWVTVSTEGSTDTRFGIQAFDLKDSKGNKLLARSGLYYDTSSLLSGRRGNVSQNSQSNAAIGLGPRADNRGQTDGLRRGLEPQRVSSALKQETLGMSDLFDFEKEAFLAIVVDTLGGDDTIRVRETVQKTVWIDAGSDNDYVHVEPTRAYISDLAERNRKQLIDEKIVSKDDVESWKGGFVEHPTALNQREEKPKFRMVSNDIAKYAYRLNTNPKLLESNKLNPISRSTVFQSLTIDSGYGHPDVDWYKFSLDNDLRMGQGDEISLIVTDRHHQADLMGRVYLDPSKGAIATFHSLSTQSRAQGERNQSEEKTLEAFQLLKSHPAVRESDYTQLLRLLKSGALDKPSWNEIVRRTKLDPILRLKDDISEIKKFGENRWGFKEGTIRWIGVDIRPHLEQPCMDIRLAPFDHHNLAGIITKRLPDFEKLKDHLKQGESLQALNEASLGANLPLRLSQPLAITKLSENKWRIADYSYGLYIEFDADHLVLTPLKRNEYFILVKALSDSEKKLLAEGFPEDGSTNAMLAAYDLKFHISDSDDATEEAGEIYNLGSLAQKSAIDGLTLNYVSAAPGELAFDEDLFAFQLGRDFHRSSMISLRSLSPDIGSVVLELRDASGSKLKPKQIFEVEDDSANTILTSLNDGEVHDRLKVAFENNDIKIPDDAILELIPVTLDLLSSSSDSNTAEWRINGQPDSFRIAKEVNKFTAFHEPSSPRALKFRKYDLSDEENFQLRVGLKEGESPGAAISYHLVPQLKADDTSSSKKTYPSNAGSANAYLAKPEIAGGVLQNSEFAFADQDDRIKNDLNNQVIPQAFIDKIELPKSTKVTKLELASGDEWHLENDICQYRVTEANDRFTVSPIGWHSDFYRLSFPEPLQEQVQFVLESTGAKMKLVDKDIEIQWPKPDGTTIATIAKPRLRIEFWDSDPKDVSKLRRLLAFSETDSVKGRKSIDLLDVQLLELEAATAPKEGVYLAESIDFDVIIDSNVYDIRIFRDPESIPTSDDPLQVRVKHLLARIQESLDSAVSTSGGLPLSDYGLTVEYAKGRLKISADLTRADAQALSVRNGDELGFVNFLNADAISGEDIVSYQQAKKTQAIIKGTYYLRVRVINFDEFPETLEALKDVEPVEFKRAELVLQGSQKNFSYKLHSLNANRDEYVQNLDNAMVKNLSGRDQFRRKDVIIGGEGNDRLIGGSAEDWIFGGPGNDVLSGGVDGHAADLLFGEEGDDLFQLIPDDLPLHKVYGIPFDPATADMMFGGKGRDRVYFLGGDSEINDDSTQSPNKVRDFVALGYDRFLGRQRLLSLVWDCKSDAFVGSPLFDKVRFKQQMAFFQTKDIEGTLIDTRGGSDVIHMDPDYFSILLGERTWGVARGDVQAGAYAFKNIEVRAGAGDDAIYGSDYAEIILGGDGNDYIVGNLGNDHLLGGDDNDIVFGTGISIGDTKGKLEEQILIGTPDQRGNGSSPFSSLDNAVAYDFKSHLGSMDSRVFRPVGLSLGRATTDGRVVPTDLVNSFAFDGFASRQGLSHLLPIGDFDGDEVSDYVSFGSSGNSYIHYGPLSQGELYRPTVAKNISPSTVAPDVRIRSKAWEYEIEVKDIKEQEKLRRQFSAEGLSQLIVKLDKASPASRQSQTKAIAMSNFDSGEYEVLLANRYESGDHTPYESREWRKKANSATSFGFSAIPSFRIAESQVRSADRSGRDICVHAIEYDNDASTQEFLVWIKTPRVNTTEVGWVIKADGTKIATFKKDAKKLSGGGGGGEPGERTVVVDGVPRKTSIAQLLLNSNDPQEFLKSDFQVVVPGDVNGDGKEDILVADSSFVSIGQQSVGRVYLITSKGNTELQDADSVWEGLGLGGSLASLGDVNRDGFDDFGFSRQVENCAGNLAARGSIFLLNGAADFGLQKQYFSLNKILSSREAQWPNTANSFVFCQVKDLPGNGKRNGRLQFTVGDVDSDAETDLLVSTSGNVFNLSDGTIESREHYDKLLIFHSISENLASPNKTHKVPSIAMNAPSSILRVDEPWKELFDKCDKKPENVGDLTYSEFSSYRDDSFFNLDRNRDGILNQAEYEESLKADLVLNGYPLFDIDNDGVDDLAVGNSIASAELALDGTPPKETGRVYLLFGQNRQFHRPQRGIETLANRDVPGLGLFVVQPGTNRPFGHQQEMKLARFEDESDIVFSNRDSWEYAADQVEVTDDTERHVALLRKRQRGAYFEVGALVRPLGSIRKNGYLVLNYDSSTECADPNEALCECAVATNCASIAEQRETRKRDRYVLAGINLDQQVFEIRDECGLLCPPMPVSPEFLVRNRWADIKIRVTDRTVSLYARPTNADKTPIMDYGSPKLVWSHCKVIKRSDIDNDLESDLNTKAKFTRRESNPTFDSGALNAFFRECLNVSQTDLYTKVADCVVWRAAKRTYRMRVGNESKVYVFQFGRSEADGKEAQYFSVDTDLNPSLTSGSCGLFTDHSKTQFAKFAVRDTQRWYKFAMLGDGQPGNYVKARTDNQFTELDRQKNRLPHYSTSKPSNGVVYSTSATHPLLKIPFKGATVNVENGATMPPQEVRKHFQVGGSPTGGQTAETLFMFDLSTMQTYVEDCKNLVESAELKFCYRTSVNQPGRLILECLSIEPGFHQTPNWVEWASELAPTHLFEQVETKRWLDSNGKDKQFNADGDTIQFDIKTVLCDALQSGRSRLLFRLKAAEGFDQDAITIADFNSVAGRFLKMNITTKPRRGVKADLYDKDMRRIASEFTIKDTRSLAADQYFIRFYDPLSVDESPVWTESLPFEIEISPPKLGESHPPTDRDYILGQHGHDFLVGNGFVDNLYGGDGIDGFECHPMEAKDQGYLTTQPDFLEATAHSINEKRREANAWDTAIISNMPKTLDRDIVWQSAPFRDAVAISLGKVILDKDGELLRKDNVRIKVSELAELHSLNLSSQTSLDQIKNLEFATNIEYLTLAGTQVQELSPLYPGIHQNGFENNARFGQLGTRQLRYLDLDFNPIHNRNKNLADGSDLNALRVVGDQEELIYLSIDSLQGTKTDGGQSTYSFGQLTDEDEALPELRFLSATNNRLKKIEGLSLTLPNVTALECVNLSNNQIKDVQLLANAGSLRWLELEGNPIKYLYELTGIQVAHEPAVSLWQWILSLVTDDLGPGNSKRWSLKASEKAFMRFHAVPAGTGITHHSYNYKFDEVFPNQKYCVYLSWVASDQASADATVGFTFGKQFGNIVLDEPLYSWKANDINGVEQSGNSPHRDEDSLTDWLRAQQLEVLEIAELTYTIDQQKAPSQRVFESERLGFDPARTKIGGWHQILEIKIPADRDIRDLQLVLHGTGQLSIDAACIVPSNPLKASNTSILFLRRNSTVGQSSAKFRTPNSKK